MDPIPNSFFNQCIIDSFGAFGDAYPIELEFISTVIVEARRLMKNG